MTEDGTRQSVAGSTDDPWLRTLYDSQWAPLYRLAALMLGSTERADEIVQDALVAVYARRRQFAPDIPVAYLRQSVVNGCRSAHRHRAVERRTQPALLTASDTPDAADALADRDSVLAALRRLPGRQQEVLVLRFYADLSEADIADALGISRGAVKSHGHRGLESLRTLLGAQGSELS